MRNLFLLIIILLVAVNGSFAQEIIKIWDTPNNKQANVTLTAYLPNSICNSKIAVIVCPGGSYFWLDKQAEGVEVAQWLNKNGIAAFVLHYRVAGVFSFVTYNRYIVRGTRYPDAKNDLYKAISYVRENAEKYGIAADKIGAMGFSAGGHLVLSAAEFAKDSLCKPNFVAPIYPVVTMQKPWAHERSKRALLGERGKRNINLIDSLSLERHVFKDMAPVFLVNCVDDPVVKYQNSVLLDSALSSVNANYLYIQYQTGGHGFGGSTVKGTSESRQWKDQFIQWIDNLFNE